jgi:WD40 repeat protein
LARPWYRARALRVFRDDTGLTVNPHLWSSIATAMDDSEWFVLMASPEASASPWVNREIEHWCATKSASRILPVLTDGTLEWDDGVGDYSASSSSALPPSLAGRFADEPRHLDLRWARDETELDLRHPRFRDAIADLAAPMHGIAKDELASEDVRQQRRAVRLARAAGSALVVLLLAALIAGGLALRSADRARDEEQRAEDATQVAQRQATQSLSRQLAANAVTAASDGQSALALLLAVEAHRAEPNLQARNALLTALVDQPLEKLLYGLSHEVSGIALSADGKTVAAGDVSGEVRIWDVESGQLLPAHPPKRSYITGLTFTPDGKRLAISGVDDGTVSATTVLWDVDAGKVAQRQPDDVMFRDAHFLASTPDGSLLVFLRTDGTAVLWSRREGRIVRSIETDLPDGQGYVVAGEVSADGTKLALAYAQPDTGFTSAIEVIEAWDLDTGARLGEARGEHRFQVPADREPFEVFRVAFSADAQTVTVVVGGTAGTRLVWDLDSGDHTEAELPSGAVGSRMNLAAVSPDAGMLAARGIDGTIRVLNTTTGSQLGSDLAAPSDFWLRTRTWRGTTAFSDDGTQLAARNGTASCACGT